MKCNSRIYHLGDELLGRDTEAGAPDVHPLALIHPWEGDHLAGAMGSDHLAEPEDDHPVVLREGDHAPPVAQGEGEAQQEVGGRRDHPHQYLSAQGDRAPGLV